MKTTRARANLTMFFLLAVSFPWGGCGDVGPQVSGDVIAQGKSAINGTGKYFNCTVAEAQKMQRALTYAFNRVKDGALAFERCMGDAYLWENKGVDGRTIAKMLAGEVVTQITCDDLHVEKDAAGKVLWVTNGVAYVSSPKSEEFSVDRTFIKNANHVVIAGIMVHEITHNRGFPHDSDAYYSNSVAEQAEACILKGQPNVAVDQGYALFWDGVRAGHAPNWTSNTAVDNCQWNVETYPERKVECYFNGWRLGYELYRDGVREGFEPTWSEKQAIANCEWNRNAYPERKIECRFRGDALGYELFRDGVRVGYAPTWTKAWATSNCQWNKDSYPSHKVECLFNSRGIGYELFFEGKRVGHEPSWTIEQAKSNCQFNRVNNSHLIVECRFGGAFMNS